MTTKHPIIQMTAHLAGDVAAQIESQVEDPGDAGVRQAIPPAIPQTMREAPASRTSRETSREMAAAPPPSGKVRAGRAGKPGGWIPAAGHTIPGQRRVRCPLEVGPRG